MAHEGFKAGSGLNVPNFDRAVVGSRADVAGVGGEGNVGNPLLMVGKLGTEGEIGSGVKAYGFVGGSGGDESAVGGEFDGGNRALVAG